MKYFGFITVRSNSSRLKKKCLLKFGRYKVIEHIIIRAIKGGILPILCTTNDKSDDILFKIAKKRKIIFFRGCKNNKIQRWYDCAKENNIDHFHTIDADDVFFDVKSIKKSINYCKEGFDIVYPSKISKSGGASEGYSFSIKSIEKIQKNIKKKNKNFFKLKTDWIEKFINKKNFKIKSLNGMEYQIKNLRLTLDYLEDYIMLEKVRSKCGNFASRKKINNFLKYNKDVIKINYFRNNDWKKNLKI